LWFLTNQQNGAAFTTITNSVKDAYLGIPDRDWLKMYGERMTKMNEEFEKGKKDIFEKSEKFAKSTANSVLPEQVTGTYTDPWFGDVEVSQNGKKIQNCETKILQD
jgi:hypothetical protein